MKNPCKKILACLSLLFVKASHKRKAGRLGAILGYLLHLLLCDGRLTLELMITEGNKHKRQSRVDSAFALLKLSIRFTS
jgi:hypothetical protein